MNFNWPNEDNNYPANTALPDLNVRIGDRIDVHILRVDDYAEVRLDAEVIWASGEYYDIEKTADLTPHLPTSYIRQNLLSIVTTDYGPGGNNWWSLKAAIVVNDLPVTYINLHYQRLGQNNTHATVVYTAKLLWT